jgi:hypothetical protein
MDTPTLVALIAAVGTVAAATVTAYFSYRKGDGKPGFAAKLLSSAKSLTIKAPSVAVKATIARNDQVHLAQVSSAVARKLKDEKYPTEVIAAFNTTLHELSLNAFAYGCRFATDRIQVGVKISRVTTTLQVENSSGQLLPANEVGTPTPLVLPSPTARRGRGLHLCRQHSDWLHLINLHDRGVIEAGFYRDPVQLSVIPQSVSGIVVIRVSGNPANPSMADKTLDAAHEQLKKGNLVAIEYDLTHAAAGWLTDKDDDDRHAGFDSNILGSFVERFYVNRVHDAQTGLSYIPPVIVGPKAFKTMFPPFSIAEDIDEAIRVLLEKSRAERPRSK